MILDLQNLMDIQVRISQDLPRPIKNGGPQIQSPPDLVGNPVPGRDGFSGNGRDIFNQDAGKEYLLTQVTEEFLIGPLLKTAVEKYKCSGEDNGKDRAEDQR